ncbi:MAG TPA: ATP synthase F1 subunit gamma [Gemmataceae bacterium]|jgi:F-type H+-transporting ATPase subunit gamma|nr:ATP synthase F1 subunit gamma [Gemmataceae bacterium]
MAKIRELVQRRKAVTNIRKITRTMELIATARFKKAFDRAVEAEAFTRKIAELAADLSASAVDVKHPLLEVRQEIKNTQLLVLCSNRGLCGGYNASILREAAGRVRQIQAHGEQLHLDLSGKRAIAYFRYQGIASENRYNHFEDKPKFEEADQIATRYIHDYIAGKIDRVDVAYMKFLNAARQVPTVETLLPLTTVSTKAQTTRTIDYEFLPSAKDILEEILPVSFKVRLFKCFLDSAVSEQIARRVAMKAATESAGDMIKSYTRQYNRQRQAQITKEIAEIVGGAEALK